MRVVKEAEERRTEILDAADRLFGEKGFDETSTNDILEAVGIARGTLYYHFASKEEIMDALIERYTEQIFRTADSIARNHTIPVIERIIRVIMAVNINRGGGKEIIQHIHKPQNARMQLKIQQIILTGLTPILATCVEEGIKTHLFNTPYPYECMELVVTYINNVFHDETRQLSEDEQRKQMEAFIFNIERLLGTPGGTLSPVLKAFGGRNDLRHG